MADLACDIVLSDARTINLALQTNGTILPPATAESDFLVAGPTPFAWLKKTLAQVKTILGLNLAVQPIVFASPLAIDGTTYKDWKCASMTDDSVINLTGVSDGEAGMIEIIIDNVGGYTITLGTMFTKNSGGGEIVTDANTDNIIAWTKSGTDMIYSISQIS